MLGGRETFGFFPFFPREEVIEHVPRTEVDRVQRDFRDSGASEVMAELQEDDTWRITAVFRE